MVPKHCLAEKESSCQPHYTGTKPSHCKLLPVSDRLSALKLWGHFLLMNVWQANQACSPHWVTVQVNLINAITELATKHTQMRFIKAQISMQLQWGAPWLGLIDMIMSRVFVQPQLLESWLLKNPHIFWWREKKRGSLDLMWEWRAEQRSPCVQFLAVMKCRASYNWLNLIHQKLFGRWKRNWRQMSSRGAETVWRNWPQRIDTFWIHLRQWCGRSRWSRAEQQWRSLLSLGRNYRLMKWSCLRLAFYTFNFLIWA